MERQAWTVEALGVFHLNGPGEAHLGEIRVEAQNIETQRGRGADESMPELKTRVHKIQEKVWRN